MAATGVGREQDASVRADRVVLEPDRLRRGVRAARGADLGVARGGVHRFGGDRGAAGATGPRAGRGHQRASGTRDVEQAVRAAYAASVLAGEPLSQRALAGRFGLSRRKVSQLVTQVTASGHGDLRGSEAA
jgi:hypothetical protein